MLQFGHVVGLVPVVGEVAQLEAFFVEMRDDGRVEVVRVAGQDDSRDRRVPAEVDGATATAAPDPSTDMLFESARVALDRVDVDDGFAA